MFAFFDLIVRFITFIVDFVVHTIEMIVHMFTLSLQGIAFISSCFAMTPPFLLPFFFSILAVGVIKLLLNMGGN